MKKLIFAACAAMVLVFGSCQKSPKQQALDLINATIEKAEKAQSMDELNTAMTSMYSQLDSIVKVNPDLGKQMDDDVELLEAKNNVAQANLKTSQKLLNNAPVTAEQPAEQPAEPAAPATENTAE